MAPSPQYLIIRHIGGQQFIVTRLDTGKSSEPVELAAPESVLVPDRPGSNLSIDLRWYLERFLDYPFEPNIAVADRVQRTLAEWGQSSFQRLFTGQPLNWYEGIRTNGLENLVIKVASDDPRVLAWPWEALRDPHGTTLAQSCRLERQLGQLSDPQKLPEGLSRTQVNILMVIARPYGDEDVGFHAVSGPLVEWVRREKVPVQIEVLRPPTFPALQQRLEARPGYYHIVHFDGHGGYGQTASSGSPYEFAAAEGHLVFEEANGDAFVVSAQKLTALLTEHRIPIMVLNACRSAGIDARAVDPFASTAAALLKAGVRSVVAMGYNLYVSGAQQFVPAFYRRLLKSGDVAEATRDGRKAMLLNDKRACARGEYPLQDWLVPVLYQQEVVPLPVISAAKDEASPLSRLPPEARVPGEYGFIGRQNAVHELERALQRQPAAAILIHGMAGVGKTTLARGFLQWLAQTGGVLEERDPTSSAMFAGVLWFAFDDIRSAEFVVNQSVTACFGPQAIALPLDQKVAALIQALREQPLLLVWDNFESAAGIEETEVLPSLMPADRDLLKQLLQELRGGRSKVLITSRSPESWLAPTEAFRLPLHGLRGEDVWTYCNAVVRDLGLTLDRSDSTSIELLKELEGHPLALRSVLLQLAETPAAELLRRLKRAFEGQAGDESTRRIFAALELLNQRFPAEYEPILQLMGLHQRHVDIDYVGSMLDIARESPERSRLNSCFSTLERGGLIHHLGNGVYSMHPALPGFLARAHPAVTERSLQFVGLMAKLANSIAPMQSHKQRVYVAVHGANFQRALTLARAAKDAKWIPALIQALGAFAFHSRDFAIATGLFQELVALWTVLNDGSEAGPYHQLGRIAEEQRDFATAERWYLQALAVSERYGKEEGLSKTQHQLGFIAQEQRDFDKATVWYRKALALEEKLGFEVGAATTYHQLGIIAQEQRDFSTAAGWYLKSLAHEEKLGNDFGAAITYHQLGMNAQEQGDFTTAEDWYKKALTIKEKIGNEQSASSTYHQLGMCAQDQGDFDTAERWYLKSLAISEKINSEHDASSTYHQLGTVAFEQGHFTTAERWCHKAFSIKQKLGDAYGTSMSSYVLGCIAERQRDFVDAAGWFAKSLALMEKLGEEHSLARTCNSLGRVHREMGNFGESGHYFLKSIRSFVKIGESKLVYGACVDFIRCLRSADVTKQQTLREDWMQAGLEEVVPLAELERNVEE